MPIPEEPEAETSDGEDNEDDGYGDAGFEAWLLSHGDGSVS